KATVGSDVVSIVNAISTDGGPVTADPGSNIDLTDFSAAATVADLATELADVHADLNAWTAGTATGTPPADTDDADDWAAYLTQLQADLGFTPSTGHGITTTGLGNALTAGEIAGVQAFVADIVGQLNADTPVPAAASSLELDDAKLNTYIDGLNGAAAAPGLAATDTMEDLYDALSGIEGFTVPSSWAAGGADAATTIEDFGLDKLAAAFSSMQEESPAVLATNRGLQDGDLVINGVTIAASSALDDTSSYTGAATSDGAASAISIAATINKSSDSTGVKAEVNATE